MTGRAAALPQRGGGAVIAGCDDSIIFGEHGAGAKTVACSACCDNPRDCHEIVVPCGTVVAVHRGGVKGSSEKRSTTRGRLQVLVYGRVCYTKKDLKFIYSFYEKNHRCFCEHASSFGSGMWGRRHRRRRRRYLSAGG